jgi:hypothetical protein
MMVRPLTYRLRGRHLEDGRTESIYDGRRRRRQQNRTERDDVDGRWILVREHL